jgi:hypothetical protein
MLSLRRTVLVRDDLVWGEVNEADGTAVSLARLYIEPGASLLPAFLPPPEEHNGSPQNLHAELPERNGSADAIIAVTATADPRINGLLRGFRWADGSISYSDPDAPSDYPVVISATPTSTRQRAERRFFPPIRVTATRRPLRAQ